jgi:hypothetical protein
MAKRKPQSKKPNTEIPAPVEEVQEQDLLSQEDEKKEKEGAEVDSEQMKSDYEALLKQQSSFVPGKGHPKSHQCFAFADKYNLTYKGNCVKTGKPLFCEKQ